MRVGIAAYRPRDAEHGVLYRVIDEHLETFLDTASHHTDGSRLPAFVEQEFRDFLACGVRERSFDPPPLGPGRYFRGSEELLRTRAVTASVGHPMTGADDR